MQVSYTPEHYTFHRFLFLLFYLAAMTYNQVHYFQVNHLAELTQIDAQNPWRIAMHRSTSYMYGMSCTDSSRS